MFRTLDRYIVRQVLPPTLIWLAVLTLTVQLRPLAKVAEALIARGTDGRDIAYLMVLLLPQALALTIPLSLLAGVLSAFVRISADREYVAMQACGISLFRLLRPVAVLGLLASAVAGFVTLWGAPAAARTFRERAFEIVVASAAGEARPLVFFDPFPGRVIYFRDMSAGKWIDLFIADSFDPRRAAVFLAKRGYLEVDRVKQRLSLVLEDGTQHVAAPGEPATYEIAMFEKSVVEFNWAALFPPGLATRTLSELATSELAEWDGPPEVKLELHRRHVTPVVCLMFAVLGLALAASTAGTGRLASFARAGLIVLLYYVMLFTGRSLAVRGHVDAWLSVWIPTGAMAVITVARVFRSAAGRERRSAVADIARRRLPELRVSMGSPRWFQMAGLRLRILDRYVARLYSAVFAVICSVLLALTYVLIVTDLATDAFRSLPGVWLLLRYCVFEMPQVLYFVLPVATLVAALVTLGVLSRNGEVMVMKACGISLYRIAAPLFVLAAISSAALFALQEGVLPASNRRAEEVRAVIRGRPENPFRQLNRAWVMGRDGTIYHYAGADMAERRLSRLSMFQFYPSAWQLRRRIFAAEAVSAKPADGWSAHEWTVSDGRIWNLSPTGRPSLQGEFNETTLRLEPIEYFRKDRPDADRMAYGALSQYIDDLRVSGTNVTPYLVTLRRKLSFPLITVIMVLIAVPFGVTMGRGGALYSIGIGVALSFGYWTMMSVFGALGSSGVMTPTLAAWAPNLLFAAGAGYLILTTRT